MRLPGERTSSGYSSDNGTPQAWAYVPGGCDASSPRTELQS